MDDAAKSYFTYLNRAELYAFKALVTQNPRAAYNALSYGDKAYQTVVSPGFEKTVRFGAGNDREAELRTMHLERWRPVSSQMFKNHNYQVAKTTGLRSFVLALPAMLQTGFLPALDARLSRLFVQEKEIALRRDRENPYQALLQEFNPEAKEDQVMESVASLRGLCDEVVSTHKFSASTQGTLPALSLTKMQKLALMRDLGVSMGIDLSQVKMYQSGSPAAIGSPEQAGWSNNYNTADFLQFYEDGMHEWAHILHKTNLCAHADTPASNMPLSTGLDEGIAYLFENHLFETPEYSAFLCEKLTNDYGADANVWMVDNVMLRHKELRFRSNRLECCDVGNWLQQCNLIEIERDIITGAQPGLNYGQLWHAKTEASFSGMGPVRSADYIKNFHAFGGLIGNIAGYVIGAQIGAQLYEAICTQVPDLSASLRRGDLRPASEWLNANIHKWGAQLPQETLLTRATGSGLQFAPLERAVRAKYRLVAIPS